jgi:imidazolonepropionase-like amidohydrolase
MATAIRAARLLTHSSAVLIEDGVVLVQDGRIEVAGPWLTFQSKIPSDAIVRNLGDVTMMPGLFDCHASQEELNRVDFYADCGG